jgi:hypothetical protein
MDLTGPWMYVLENGEAGTIHVPHAFDFVGKVEYQRQFAITAQDFDACQFLLVVQGAGYSCDIFVNGEYIGNHAGGSTSFSIPLSPEYLQVSRDNILRIVVDNQLNARSTLPLRPLTWGARNYGGIYRDIYILKTPKLAIHDAVVECAISPETGGPATISIAPHIEGTYAAQPPGSTLAFSVEAIETVSGVSVAHSNPMPIASKDDAWTCGNAALTLTTPRLWSPETPDLYTLKCHILAVAGGTTTVVDEYLISYGLRSIALKGGDILFNGKRLIVRAVSWYEDHPTWGNAIPYEEREKDIILIKQLGANTVRFAGNPPDPAMLDLCDRYGLLAMEELPLANCPAAVLTSESYQELAAGMTREMVVRDRNHPSVIAWGMGDEVQCHPHQGAAFFTRIVNTAHALDSRPTYRALRLGVPDSCVGLTDIEIANVYIQDAKQTRLALDEWRQERKGTVVMARIGVEVDQENVKGFNDPLSQQAQARFFVQRFEILRTLDFDGVVIWSFNDWRGDRPALTVHTGDPRLHTTGLVNDLRVKRLAYGAVYSVLHGEKVAALPAGSYSPRAPILFVLAGFFVLIVTAYVYNSNRRFREHVNRSLMSSYNFFADVRDRFGVSVFQTTLLGLIVSVAMAIVISSVFLHFRDSLFLDNLLSYLLVSDELKAIVVRWIWDPLRFIGILTGMVFVALLILSGIVHQLRLIMKARVYAFHAYTVTIWSTTPLLIFIPLGMIMYRVMEGPVYVISALVIIVLFLIWFVVRLLEGISIVYDVYPPKIFAAGLFVFAIIGGLAYVYFDVVESAPMYLTFLYTMVGAGR